MNTPSPTATSRRNFSELPIINISGLFSDKLQDRQSVAKELGEAARNIGFFYISGHGIHADQIAALRTAASRFFAQDLDWKMRHHIDRKSVV